MRKNMFKALMAAFAVGILVSSPSATMTTHAFGFDDEGPIDDTQREEWSLDDWDDYDNSDDSSSDTTVDYDDLYADEPDYDEPSYDEPSYEEPSQPSESNGGSSNESHDGGSSSSSSSTSSSSSADVAQPVARPKDKNAENVKVPESQTFRITKDPTRSIFDIYHMGGRKASFVAKDADGKEVTYNTIKLEKGDDGLWYLNVTYPATVDTTTLVMEVRAGDETYLSTTLGVSGIKMNGVLAISTIPVEETAEEVSEAE